MPLADFSALPVLGLMGIGVLTAVVGHATRRRELQAFGIGCLFAGTVLMVVLGYLDFQDGGIEGDPRKPNDPRVPNF